MSRTLHSVPVSASRTEREVTSGTVPSRPELPAPKVYRSARTSDTLPAALRGRPFCWRLGAAGIVGQSDAVRRDVRATVGIRTACAIGASESERSPGVGPASGEPGSLGAGRPSPLAGYRTGPGVRAGVSGAWASPLLGTPVRGRDRGFQLRHPPGPESNAPAPPRFGFWLSKPKLTRKLPDKISRE